MWASSLARGVSYTRVLCFIRFCGRRGSCACYGGVVIVVFVRQCLKVMSSVNSMFAPWVRLWSRSAVCVPDHGWIGGVMGCGRGLIRGCLLILG
jgi:hypothetical protein